jgi:AGCS family alanine or glycine:cation symporter
MVVLICGTGLYFTLKTGVFQVRGFSFIWRNTAGTLLAPDGKQKSGGLSPFQAVSTALAGTMGVGNIAGVATALTLGGPGSIFWMWLSSFFGMMTKYAEISLAVKFRRLNPEGGFLGGPMYYMREGLRMPLMGGIFAAICALCSFGVGNMTQINAVSAAARGAFGVPAWQSGVVASVIVACVIFGGIKRIARMAELTIPFITIAFIACSITALLRNSAFIGGAFSLIFEGAFSLRSAGGGIMGYGMLAALRYGVARGVFTNEAGMGSSSIAHASAECKSPAHQGAWGIFEVFLDSNVVCTLTGLVLLTAKGGTLWHSGPDGVDMTSEAFVSVFGPAGAVFIAVSVMVFAIAGMLGWCLYGETSVGYLTSRSKAAILIYRLIFVLCTFAGAVSDLRAIWGMADALNALLAIPNIIAVLMLRREVALPAACPGKRRRRRVTQSRE